MDDIFANWLKQDDEGKRVAHTFRSVFSTEEGKFVLQIMLNELKFLEQCKNEQDMALNNFAKTLVMTVFWNEETGTVDNNRLFNFIRKMIAKYRRTK